MSLFKIKNNKNINSDDRVTLDAKHNIITKQFNDDKKNLRNLEREFKKSKILLKDYNNNYNINNISIINNLEDKIDNIKKKK